MQGLADGYFVIPYTIADYLARTSTGMLREDAAECRSSVESVKSRIEKLLSINGNKTVAQFHREVGSLMWNNAGMARSEESLTEALTKIPEIRAEFWENVRIPAPQYPLLRKRHIQGRSEGKNQPFFALAYMGIYIMYFCISSYVTLFLSW